MTTKEESTGLGLGSYFAIQCVFFILKYGFFKDMPWYITWFPSLFIGVILIILVIMLIIVLIGTLIGVNHHTLKDVA